MKNKNAAAVDSYLEALRKGDLSIAPIADDIRYTDPIAGIGEGRENFEAFLSGFLPAINGVTLVRHICEDDLVATQFRVDSVFGDLEIMEYFRVVDGKIVEAEGYFDPRPILG